MQHANELPDYPEIFRTQDSVGSDTSIFPRVIRQLAHHGKPMGQVFLFNVVLSEQKRMPLGVLTCTKNNRVIFWPVLPQRAIMTCTRSNVETLDHITLDFPSERSHVTGYKASGKANHAGNGWKCMLLPGSTLRFWFMLLVQMPVIMQQDLLVQRQYPTPPNDWHRRTNEFRQFAEHLVPLDISLPAIPSIEQYLCFGFYLTPEFVTQDQLPAALFPGQAMAELVDNWPSQSEYPVLAAQYLLGERHLVIAAACPPGQLKDPICFGFPYAPRSMQ